MPTKSRKLGVKKVKISNKNHNLKTNSSIDSDVSSISKNEDKIKNNKSEYDIIKEYYNLVMNVDTLIKIRKKVLLEKCPSLVFKTRNNLDDRIEKYLSSTNTVKRSNISQTTLASSLVMSKSQYSKTIEKYFEKFDLNRNIIQPSVKVMMKYEKLRLLVMEYYRERRRDDNY